MQRTFPGQLPSCRRDIHNAIVSIDLTSTEQVTTLLDTILTLIRRGIPLRWGIVPQTSTPGALEQAKVAYHLQETYGITALEVYLQAVSVALNLCVLVELTYGAVIRQQETWRTGQCHI